MNLARGIAMVTAILVAGVTPARALDVLEDVTKLRPNSELAMGRVAKGDLEGGIRVLMKAWPLPPSEIETMIGQSKLQQPMVQGRFGDAVGYEFIREETVGTALVRHVFLQRFERHAMRWVITYYRNADGWIVNSVKFDDNLSSLFPNES